MTYAGAVETCADRRGGTAQGRSSGRSADGALDGQDQRIRLRIEVNVNESRWWATPPARETEAPGIRMGWSLHRHLLHAGLVDPTTETSTNLIASSVAERLLLCVSSAVDCGGRAAEIEVRVADVVHAQTPNTNTTVSLELVLHGVEGAWQAILPPGSEPGPLTERVCAAIAAAIETSRFFVAVQSGISAAVIPDGSRDG